MSRPKASTCLLSPLEPTPHLGSMPTALWPLGHCSGCGCGGGGGEAEAEAEAVNFLTMCPWGEGALNHTQTVGYCLGTIS